MKAKFSMLFITLLMGIWVQSAIAQKYGILNQKAPPIGATEWMNLPEGKTSLEISDLKGKVIYLYAFQNW